MKKNFSLHRTLLWSMMLTAFLAVGGMAVFRGLREYGEYSKDIRMLKKKHVAARKEQSRDEVEKVLAYIQYKRSTTERKLKENIRLRVNEALALSGNLYEKYKEKKSSDEIGDMIREALRPLRFHQGRGYFFIYDMKGISILMPFSPNLEGKNLWDLQDSKGQFTIRRFVSMIKEKKEGYLHWHWYKPGNTQNMAEKIGFAKYFAPLDWWIGTGEYTEDAEKDTQQECLAWINNIRYGKDGYIFVYDFAANTLAHYKPQNIGINRWHFTDPHGVKVLQELIRISQNEEGGYLQYVGSIRPSTGEPAYKLSYAKAVPDWQWMVGTGVYTDEIESILTEKNAAAQNEIIKDMLISLAVLAGLILFIAAVSGFISGKIMKNFRIFSDFFKKSVTESHPVEEEALFFSEFRELAFTANRMTEERDRSREEIRKMEEELQRAQKMESLGRLAGGVAHDLNNVLAAAVSYPEMILMELPEDSSIRGPLLSIKTSGLRATAILQDLLSLARSGIPRKEIVSLNRIIRKYLKSPAHEQLRSTYPDIRIHFLPAEDLLHICGSPDHLEKAVANLIFNAAESVKTKGTVTITTENRYMDRPFSGYDTIREGDYCVLKVADEGPGISPEDKEKIFEPFYSKKIMGRSGTGLGMAVVWATVHDHGGYIHIDSPDEGGNVFELYFYASREKETHTEISLKDFSGNGETVLVADDMEDQREIASLMLQKLNYRVHTVADGNAAVEWLTENRADILLLDMIMDPRMDGLETYQQVVAIRPGQKAVITSGFPENERVAAARKLGAGAYLRKPYTMEKLGKAIKEELKRRQ